MKTFSLGFLILLFLVRETTAQLLPSNYLSLKSVWINFQAPNTDKAKIFDNLNHAIEIGYGHHFKSWLSLNIPFRLGAANFPQYDHSSSKVRAYSKLLLYAGLDLTAYIHFFNSKRLSPFVYAGIGGALEDFSDFYVQAPLGLGLNLKINDLVTLNAQSDYRLGFKDGYDNFQHAVGIRICLCGLEKDSDKDGITDKKDLCPDVFGLKELQGCPDSDLDGITDKEDNCPTVPGVAENKGCPADSDLDGVYDVEDKCPTVAGSVQGCPDKDKDGIADKDDRCPDVAGSIKLTGCPDKDKDGIADKDDNCPEVAGPVSNKGCPEPTDRDKDGVMDKDDKCPETNGPASNNGCPEIKVEKKKSDDLAIHSVQFETGTTTLTKSSYKILDEIYAILVKYPEMNLRVEGNTDNVGDEKQNKMLSEKRARACLHYLVKKGIASVRLSSMGNGDTNPSTENTTAQGRKMNRRTEFLPVWR